MRKGFVVVSAVLASVVTAGCTARRTISEVRGVSSMGAQSAPIVLVYFTDYQCPECREFTSTTLRRIKPLVDAGRLRLVVSEIATTAQPQAAAVAARCAQEFGKYWPFVEALSEDRPDSLTLTDVASRAHVPADPFARCIAADRYGNAVRRSTTEANDLGVLAAPAMLLGPAKKRLSPEGLRRERLETDVIDSLLKRELDQCGC